MAKQIIGGQAVIEGVIMHSKGKLATAVRKPNGKIIIKKDKINSITKKYPIFKKPFLRGVISLIEMVYFGTKGLIFSANVAEDDDEENEPLTKSQITFTMITSFGLSLLIFFALPYFLTNIFGLREDTSPIVFNLMDGIIKLGILVGYIYAISFTKDVKRLFQYHGAEHLTVHMYEHDLELKPKNAKSFSTVHHRCGSSFLMIVILVGVIIFSIVPILFKNILPSFMPARLGILFISRMILLPVIAGVSYEWLKFSDKIKHIPVINWLYLPGLWVQKLTTKRPDKEQLEVAIAALKAVEK